MLLNQVLLSLVFNFLGGKQPETTVKVDKYAQFKQRNRVVDPDEQ